MNQPTSPSLVRSKWRILISLWKSIFSLRLKKLIEFPAIVYKDGLTSIPEVSSEPTDFEGRLGRIYDRRVDRVQVLDLEELIMEMGQTVTDKLRMEHTRSDGQVVFASHAWRRLFGIYVLLVRELKLEFFSICRFSNTMLDLDVADTFRFQLGGLRCQMSWREFILALRLHTADEIDNDRFRAYWDESSKMIASKADLRGYWAEISSFGDFLTMVPSYTAIREPLRRLCHCLIAFTIAGRGQAPEKVTTIDPYYLRSIDEGTVNVPYLLALYLFRIAFEDLVVRDLTMIDMDELVGAAAGAAHVDLKVAEEGVQADLGPAKAGQAP
ncbi:hypothetical protein Tco_1284427 [Tanacetum coccineum]